MSTSLLHGAPRERALSFTVFLICLALSGCLREESRQVHPCAPRSLSETRGAAQGSAPWWVGEWTIDRARLAAGHPPPRALLLSSLAASPSSPSALTSSPPALPSSPSPLSPAPSVLEGERLHQPVPLGELPLSAAARGLMLPVLDKLSARWHFHIYPSRLRWRRGEGRKTLSLTPLPGGRSLRVDEEGEEAGRLYCGESGLWWRWRADAPLPLQRGGELRDGRAREE